MRTLLGLILVGLIPLSYGEQESKLDKESPEKSFPDVIGDRISTCGPSWPVFRFFPAVFLEESEDSSNQISGLKNDIEPVDTKGKQVEGVPVESDEIKKKDEEGNVKARSTIRPRCRLGSIRGR